MHFLDIFYSNYYRFYKKVINDPEPHFATILALSFSESLLINAAFEIIALKWFCYQINIWIQIAVVALLIYINYIVYFKTGKFQKLIKEKPVIANSSMLSIIITWLFFLITVSWLFWGSIYGKYLLSQCR